MLKEFCVGPRESLIQKIGKPRSSQILFHGRDGHIFIEVLDLKCGNIEMCRKASKSLSFILLNGEETIRCSWHPLAIAEVGHK